MKTIHRIKKLRVKRIASGKYGQARRDCAMNEWLKNRDAEKARADKLSETNNSLAAIERSETTPCELNSVSNSYSNSDYS